MGRSKIKREYSFKPVYKEFAPLHCTDCSAITLNHDEIEAIFLMDAQNMYQDDAAKKMGVSRPTFSKIIKSARFKVATALVTCKKIVINDEKESFCVMACTVSKENFDSIKPNEKYIAFITINKDSSYSVEFVENPVFTQKAKPAMALSQIAATKEVNFFICSDAGAGLVNSLLSKGIHTIEKEPKFTIESLVDEMIKNYY